MVQITESVHPRSLSFANQRKVVILRDQGFAWRDITSRVVNYSTANLELLETHDWLKSPTNRVLVHWPVTSAAEGVVATGAPAGS